MDCKEKPVAYCKYCGVPLYSGNSIYRLEDTSILFCSAECALYYFNVEKEELD